MDIPNPAAEMSANVSMLEKFLKQPFSPNMNAARWTGFVFLLFIIVGFWTFIMRELED